MAENAAAPSPPANEAAAFKQIKELLGSGKADEAVPLMEDYLKRHARGAHEDEVAYRLGDYLFSQGEYARAIPVLRQVTENHPESSWAPDGLYKIGLSYLELDKTSEAESALQEVGILYPFSEAAGKAAKKLEACCR
jgi:tol-pal system protein YbgF